MKLVAILETSAQITHKEWVLENKVYEIRPDETVHELADRIIKDNPLFNGVPNFEISAIREVVGK